MSFCSMDFVSVCTGKRANYQKLCRVRCFSEMKKRTSCSVWTIVRRSRRIWCGMLEAATIGSKNEAELVIRIILYP